MMDEWVKAEDAPVEWEGTKVWRFMIGIPKGVESFFVPRGYSRRPVHCGGIFFKKMEIPAPPTLTPKEQK